MLKLLRIRLLEGMDGYQEISAISTMFAIEVAIDDRRIRKCQ